MLEFLTTERMLGVVLLGALAALVWYAMWREDFDGMRSSWRFHRELKKRQPLTFDEFYRRFYQASEIDEQIVRRMLELHLEVFDVKPTLMRPEDNLSRIFEFPFDVELIERIEEEFGFTFGSDDLATLDGSFDSLTRYVDARLRQTQ